MPSPLASIADCEPSQIRADSPTRRLIVSAVVVEVKVRDGGTNWGWGVVVNVVKKPPAALATLSSGPGSSRGSGHVVDIHLNCSPGSSESGSRPKPCLPHLGEKGEMYVIIEEGPITVAPLEIVKLLEQVATKLAKGVNYVGATTVEYLYNMETGECYFLELNQRLQEEHPVTEWIAEINLPATQVVVGMGIPLWQILEIRRFYGMEHGGGYDAWKKTSNIATPFDFDRAISVRPKGHCVAVRVTSEDPDDGFKAY